MRLTRSRLLLLAGALGLVVAAMVLTGCGSSGGSSNSSPYDAKLRSTISSMLPQLNQKGKYPVTDPSVRSFQGWEFNIKTSLQKAIKQVHSPAFAQVVLIDPTTMPPTPISMTQPGHTTLGVTSGLLHTALKSHTTPCGTIVGLKQRKYRVCVAALTTPKPLKPSESNAVLEIFRPLK